MDPYTWELGDQHGQFKKITKIWYGPLWAYVNKGTWLQQKHLYISDIVLILTRYLSWLFVCKLDNPLPCWPCSAWGIVFGMLLVMVYYGDFSVCCDVIVPYDGAWCTSILFCFLQKRINLYNDICNYYLENTISVQVFDCTWFETFKHCLFWMSSFSKHDFFGWAV